MTASMSTRAVRVRVQDAWDDIRLDLPDTTPLAEVKRLALEATRNFSDPAGYVLKFRGAEVSDETRTLGEAEIVPNATLIVLPRRRRPVW